MLDVYKPGTEVTLASALNAKAHVLSVMIKTGHHVTYEVAWWDGQTRNTAWIDHAEIASTPGKEKLAIGFLGQEQF